MRFPPPSFFPMASCHSAPEDWRSIILTSNAASPRRLFAIHIALQKSLLWDGFRARQLHVAPRRLQKTHRITDLHRAMWQTWLP